VLVGREQHLGLALVGADVVGDLDRPDLAALIRGAEADARRDRWMSGDVGAGRRGHLRVVVVVGVGGRERRAAGAQAPAHGRHPLDGEAGPAHPAHRAAVGGHHDLGVVDLDDRGAGHRHLRAVEQVAHLADAIATDLLGCGRRSGGDEQPGDDGENDAARDHRTTISRPF
jgi:hypothetical protein